MFNSGFNGYSLSDVAAVTKDGEGWGGGASWWIIILFLFVFCGWGGNGFGNRGNDAALQGALTRTDLCQDMNFQSLENGVRGIQQGLCDGFYAQNSTMLQGFNGLQQSIGTEFRGVDNAICNLGFNVQQGFNSSNMTAMQNANAIQAQLAQCCCDTRAGLADVKYQMATDTCAINNNIQSQTRDIIENANNNTRSILDFLVQDKISTLQQENANLKLAASQSAQNNYLVSQLSPKFPVPAYVTCNPFTGQYGYPQTNTCGCGNCNCG